MQPTSPEILAQLRSDTTNRAQRFKFKEWKRAYIPEGDLVIDAYRYGLDGWHINIFPRTNLLNPTGDKGTIYDERSTYRQTWRLARHKALQLARFVMQEKARLFRRCDPERSSYYEEAAKRYDPATVRFWDMMKSK